MNHRPPFAPELVGPALCLWMALGCGAVLTVEPTDGGPCCDDGGALPGPDASPGTDAALLEIDAKGGKISLRLDAEERASLAAFRPELAE